MGNLRISELRLAERTQPKRIEVDYAHGEVCLSGREHR